MTSLKIRDVEVKFPFTPYDIQKNYMEKVIECLETKQNGILESPTGTGKTLSLLCASLAWMEHRKRQVREQYENVERDFLKLFNESTTLNDSGGCTPPVTVPKIIYASRTHSQLQQAMQEMKRTAYSNMKACVLGSREQMCINEAVIEEKDASLKVNMCRTKVKKKECGCYLQIEKEKTKPPLCNLQVVDMEDIVSFGRQQNFCPYYMARELKAEADVVFMPYNYLLDPRTSKNMGVEFNESVLIFDEAHNIEKVCEDAVSIELNGNDIQAAIDDLNAIYKVLSGGKKLDVDEVSFSLDQLEILEGMLMKLKNEVDDLRLVPLALEGTVFDGDYIFDILKKAEICDKNSMGLADLIANVMDFLASTKLVSRTGYGLEIINNLLFIVFYKRDPQYQQKIKECFKVQISEGSGGFRRFSQWTQSSQEKSRSLNFWCFCPGFAMNMLMDQNIHSIILTSGTLAPLKPLISELELTIGVRIENPHIVASDQVCVKVLSKGPDMELLNSNFLNRNNPKYIQSLGLVIVNLIRIIPDGVLIFFPSYFIMEKSIEHWKESGVWENMNEIKPICIEAKNKISFNNAMTEYYSKIQDPNYRGAIFMGVCRGKMSEGLDFADINGRAVLITGLPYPPLKEPKVILKKQYLDFRNSKDKEYLTGDDWYTLEATRAINQAIGRVIRHKNDYGAIVLLDSRFTYRNVKSNLSLWLQQHITDMKDFSQIVRHLRLFFKKAQEKELNVTEESGNMNESCSPEVKIHSRPDDLLESPSKRRR